MAVGNLVISTLFLAGITLFIFPPTADAFYDFFPKVALNITTEICCTPTTRCLSESDPRVAESLISVYDTYNATSPQRILVKKGNSQGAYAIHIPDHHLNFVRMLLQGTLLVRHQVISHCTEVRDITANFISWNSIPINNVYYGTPIPVEE